MKKLVLLSVLVVAVATPDVMAQSLEFCSEMGYQSWTVTAGGGIVDVSFDHLGVDYSDPMPDAVVGDSLGLPTMAFSNITVHNNPHIGDYILADLTPLAGQQLTITDDVTAGLVMIADVGSGGTLLVGTNWVSYMDQQSDLSNVATTSPGYSAVIDGFVAGTEVDLSFGSDSQALYGLLEVFAGDNTTEGSVSGTMDGQIHVIPEPCTMLLLGFGSLVLLRKRRA